MALKFFSIKNTAFFFLLILFSGCTSLLYSPALQLPTEKLEKLQVDVAGGVEYLPETRPGSLSFLDHNQSYSLGFSGQLGLGISDDISVFSRGWLEQGQPDFEYRFGFSLSAAINQDINATSRLVLLPKGGITCFGDKILGWGAGVSLVYQLEITPRFSFHTGAGMLWGFGLGAKDFAPASFNKNPENGVGYHFNNGIAWHLGYGLRVNLEVIPTIQYSNYDKERYFLMPAMIGIGYTFKKRG